MKKRTHQVLATVLGIGALASVSTTGFAQGAYPNFLLEDFQDGTSNNDWLGGSFQNGDLGGAFFFQIVPLADIGPSGVGDFALHFERNQGDGEPVPARLSMFMSITDGGGLFGEPSNPRDLTIYEAGTLSFDIRHGFPNGAPPVPAFEDYQIVFREVAEGAFNEAALDLSDYVDITDTYQTVTIPISDFRAAFEADSGAPFDATIARAFEIQLDLSDTAPFEDGSGNIYVSLYIDNVRIGPAVETIGSSNIDPTTYPFPNPFVETWEDGNTEHNWGVTSGTYRNGGDNGFFFAIFPEAGIGVPLLTDGVGTTPAPSQALRFRRNSGNPDALPTFNEVRFDASPDRATITRDVTQFSYISFDMKLGTNADVDTYSIAPTQGGGGTGVGLPIEDYIVGNTELTESWQHVAVPFADMVAVNPTLDFTQFGRFTIYWDNDRDALNTGDTAILWYELDNLTINGPPADFTPPNTLQPLELFWDFEDGTTESNLAGLSNVSGGRATGGTFESFGTGGIPVPVESVSNGEWTVTNTWDGTGFQADFLNAEFEMLPGGEVVDLVNFESLFLRIRKNAPMSDNALVSVRIEDANFTFQIERADLTFSGEGSFEEFTIPITEFSDGDGLDLLGNPEDPLTPTEAIRVTVVAETPADTDGSFTVDMTIDEIRFILPNINPVLADFEDSSTNNTAGDAVALDGGLFGGNVPGGFQNTTSNYTATNVSTKQAAGSLALNVAGTTDLTGLSGFGGYMDIDVPMPGGGPINLGQFESVTVRARLSGTDTASFWGVRLEDATDPGNSFQHEEVAFDTVIPGGLTSSYQDFIFPLDDFNDGDSDNPDGTNVPVNLSEIVNLSITSDPPASGSYDVAIDIDGIVFNSATNVPEWSLY